MYIIDDWIRLMDTGGAIQVIALDKNLHVTEAII